MSAQVREDVKRIQEMLSRGEYETIYHQYASVLQTMLFVQSLEEWLDFIRQEGTLEEEPLALYLSAWRGECLLLGCYQGDATQAVLDHLKDKLPAELGERLSDLPPIVIDIDEVNGTLEKQIIPYQNVLERTDFRLHVDFEDIYCAGAYFLSASPK